MLGKNKTYLIEPRGKFSTKFGTYDFSKNKPKVGKRIKIGKEPFTIVEPNINDFLFRSAKRLPQIVLPKDVSMIIAFTGCSPKWNVVDAGTGSGFMSIVLANIIKPGKVFTYEKRKDFFEKANNNIKNSGLKNIINKNKDFTKGVSNKDIDLVTLDMEHSEKAVKVAEKILKPGGYLAVYSMHTEQLSKVSTEIRKHNFTEPIIIENIQRNWKAESSNSKSWTRPKGEDHSVFLTFARKI